MAVRFLVDTNVLSEMTKARPNVTVREWLAKYESILAVNPIVLGELEFGILTLPSGGRRTSLWEWYLQVAAAITVLEMNRTTADVWARLLADAKLSGRTIPIKDSLIAASAIEYGLIVATRNTSDYRFCGIGLTNPFEL